MFRHLPILLVILASTSAYAEQGFFEQLLELVEEQGRDDDERTGRRARQLNSQRTACPAANNDTPSQPEALSRKPPPFRACAAAAARSAHRVADRLFKKYGTIFRGGACRAS